MTALTLSEAKEHLNIPSSDTSNDLELAATIEAAESAIEQECGPLMATSVTERVRGGRMLTLNRTPVVSLTSITPVGGAAVSLAGVYVDPRSGVVEFDGSGSFSAPRYTVAYQAGRSEVPADLLQAVKELVRHMWATQRGSQPPYSGAILPDEGDILGDGSSGFTFPRRVEQLMEPHRQVAI